MTHPAQALARALTAEEAARLKQLAVQERAGRDEGLTEAEVRNLVDLRLVETGAHGASHVSAFGHMVLAYLPP